MSYLPKQAELELLEMAELPRSDAVLVLREWCDRWLAQAATQYVVTGLELVANRGDAVALRKERRCVALRALGALLTSGEQSIMRETRGPSTYADAELTTYSVLAVRSEPKEG